MRSFIKITFKMNRVTIKDLNAQITILKSECKHNKERVDKLEGKQAEVINQKIIVNNIQQKLKSVVESQRELMESINEIKTGLSDIKLSQTTVIENQKSMQENIKLNTDFRNKNQKFLVLLWGVLTIIAGCLITYLINTFL